MTTPTPLEATKTKLREMAHATDDMWKDVLKGAGAVWEDMRCAVNGVFVGRGKPGRAKNKPE